MQTKKSPEDQTEFEALESRIRAILPEEYQDSYEDVQPVSMGSAGLKYGGDGKVAWDEIWETFCDLAMAGGPPHKGVLLEPGAQTAIDAQPAQYREVVEEICRGVVMVTGLAAKPSPVSGWIHVECEDDAMAGWLLRAIVMENVCARAEGVFLDLPAGPGYRLEKEIKNVITVIAKTCHYWVEHMWLRQQRAIADLFAKMAVESPLIQPARTDRDLESAECGTLRGKMAETIRNLTGLASSNHSYVCWLGLECPDVRAAIWMMRALVASNILSRREETVLFVPINPSSDPNGETVARAVAQIHGFAGLRGIL